HLGWGAYIWPIMGVRANWRNMNTRPLLRKSYDTDTDQALGSAPPFATEILSVQTDASRNRRSGPS
ncbi:MAG: hypothetical protein ACYC61_24300, partial [Isosphaeraceae bacterium]